jgi:hypothetical protein
VNASAQVLVRNGEVQSKIRKVRTFGRAARTISAAIFGFGLVGSAGVLLTIVFGPVPGSGGGFDLPGFDGITTSQLTTISLKAWAFAGVSLMVGLSLAAVHQLYRLFGNLAAAAIYTPENVRCVRYVGLLTLLSAMSGVAIPVATAALVAWGFLDASVPFSSDLAFSAQSLSALISAGLILLASWIMDVGLYEKNHADELRRDADLVI